MTPLAFLRNLWRNAFPPYPEFPADMGSATPAPQPPPPPPEPSCFAKGIAESIVHEPGQWKEMAKGSRWMATYRSHRTELCVKHRKTGVILRMWRRMVVEGTHRTVSLDHSESLNVYPLSDIDRQLILDTILAHPIGQFIRIRAEQVREDRRRQKALAHFETIGCPNST